MPRRAKTGGRVAGIALAAAAMGAWGCGATPAASATRFAPAKVVTAAKTHFRFFSPSSFWNEPVARDAETDPRSPELVAALAVEAAAEEPSGVGPGISTRRYSGPVYRVPAHQPTVRVPIAGHPADGALR